MGKKVPPSVVEEILRMDSEGMSQRRIAVQVGLRHETICRILHKYHDMAFDRIIGRLAATRSRHISRLEHAADLAMQAFTASDKPAASFLSEYRAALADIRAILGIVNRIEPEADVPGAGSDLVTEALQRIAEMHQQKRAEVGNDDDQDQNQGDNAPEQDRPGDQDGGGGGGDGDRGHGPAPPIAPWLWS
jgi:hypothetical protein